MTRDVRPPLWTTLLVVIGSLGMVALALYAVGDRTSVFDETALDGATTEPSAPVPSPTPSPTGSAVATESASPTPSPSPSPTPVVVEVDVLNQTTVAGLAGRAAEALSDAGWPVGRIDNAAFASPSSTLYVPADLQPAADSFVDAFPVVTRSRASFEGLATDALTLVLAEPDAEEWVEALESSGVRGPTPVGTSP